MFRFKIVLIPFLLTLIMIGCTHYVYIHRSRWQKVVADGKPNEWVLPLKYYDEKGKLQYAIANDAENLYVCIRATDKAAQAKMLMAGMLVTIDTSEKGLQQASIRFPLGRENEFMLGAHQQQWKENTEEPAYSPDKRLSSMKLMQLSGFYGMQKDSLLTINNEEGIRVGIMSDSSGSVTYEAAIPFSTFYKERLSLSDSTKIVDVAITLNAITKSEKGRKPGMDDVSNDADAGAANGSYDPNSSDPYSGSSMRGSATNNMANGMNGMGGGMNNGMGGGMNGGMGGGMNNGMGYGGGGHEHRYSANSETADYLAKKITIKSKFELSVKRK